MVWGMWNSSYLRPAVWFEDAAWTTPVHGAVWFASKIYSPRKFVFCEKTIDNMQMQQMWTQRLPSLKLTLRTWKWMLFCRLDSIPFEGLAYLFRCEPTRCQFLLEGGNFPTKLYKTPEDHFKWWGDPSPTTKKTHKTPRSSGFLLQCIGASKKDGFLVEVGWGPRNLSLPPDGSGNRKSPR